MPSSPSWHRFCSNRRFLYSLESAISWLPFATSPSYTSSRCGSKLSCCRPPPLLVSKQHDVSRYLSLKIACRFPSLAEQHLYVDRIHGCWVYPLFQPTFASCSPLTCRWSMHRTGKYKFINMTFGIFPFIATALISTMNEHSSPARLWLSIVRHDPTGCSASL